MEWPVSKRRAKRKTCCRSTTAAWPREPRLRINRPRRQRLHGRLLDETVERICRLQVRSVNIFLTASTFGSLLFFVVIGTALAVQTWWPTSDRSVLSGFVMTLLFMKGRWKAYSACCR